MYCGYNKTYNGKCEQSVASGNKFCYYHKKVIAGLIESDPVLSMRQSQTISLKS